MSGQVVFRCGASVAVVAGALVAGGHQARAATAEAFRQVDAQGVELIRNRLPVNTPFPAASAASGATRVAVAAPEAGRPVSVPAAELVRAGKAVVPPAQQGERDGERLGILRQELATEVGRLQRLQQALDHPAVKARRDVEEWLRLTEQRERHEQNIKALDAEMRRAQRAGVR